MNDLAPRARVTPWIWPVAAGVAGLLLSTAARYGIFRDEFYYLMCAAHPAWGYVDHPPLAMIFLKAWTTLFGDSIWSLRVPGALLGGAVTVGAAMLAREMRGGATAQVLAAITVGLMPGTLALGAFYSMNTFDVAFWVGIAWIVCRLLDANSDRRWWWALGAAFGLGVLNKYSVGFLGVGLGVGLLLSPLRRELLSRKGLAAAAIALVLALPHLIWQVASGWPTLEFIRNAQGLKNIHLGVAGFWGQQVLMAHPGYLPLWLAGLTGLLATRRLRPWRPLGVAYAVVAVWLTVQGAKPYYLVPAYPLVMTAGAVVIFGWLERWRRAARPAAIVLPLLLAVEGLLIAPLAIPLLSISDYMAWERTLGLRPKMTEHNEVGVLPQHFADRFGWEDLARTVRAVVEKLPPSERSTCLVVAQNYGECGAINYWGLPEGVRPAVSGHNSCYTWWPVDIEPGVVVIVGASRSSAERVFETVRLGGTHRSDLAMPYEQELSVWVCRGWRMTPAEAREAARFAI